MREENICCLHVEFLISCTCGFALFFLFFHVSFLRIDNTESKCLEYRENFMTHSFLWTDSARDSCPRLLLSGVPQVEIGGEDLRPFLARGSEGLEVCLRKKRNGYRGIPRRSRTGQELVEFEEGGMSFREIMHRIKASDASLCFVLLKVLMLYVFGDIFVRWI